MRLLASVLGVASVAVLAVYALILVSVRQAQQIGLQGMEVVAPMPLPRPDLWEGFKGLCALVVLVWLFQFAVHGVRSAITSRWNLD